jgi:hypothetical protein
MCSHEGIWAYTPIGWERGTVGVSNLAYLPQYDRFMGIGDEKEELLEMLLGIHWTEGVWRTRMLCLEHRPR